jgi:hypothetical protein
MSYEAPIEPGLIMIFARSLGGVNALYADQLDAAPGQPVITPPTFVRSLDHFDPHSSTRPSLPREAPEFGGRADTVHAEQHFEYFAPFRAGEHVVVSSSPGRVWSKQGRSGHLAFAETFTEYCTPEGEVLVRARKVSVVRSVTREAP